MKSIRHCILVALLFCIISAQAFSQRLTVARVDTTRFPEMRALLYILDATGKPITGLSAGDVAINENGMQRQVLSLDCPPPDDPKAISSVLTIDVSGSMAWSSKGAPENPNISLARAAASAWVDALPEGSECALSTFDDRGLIHRDFTTNKSLLLESILTLEPNGGTNYNSGLVTPPAGALPISKGGRHKRIVVFLTDGRGVGNENTIVDEALRLDAIIFCVTLGMPAPEVLQNVARRTGGEYFENVTSVEEAQGIYRAILYRSLGGKPCEVVWRSEPACTIQKSGTIAIPSRALSSAMNYTAPASSIPRLALDPPSVAFGKVVPGTMRELNVTITAIEKPVTVRQIKALGPGSAITLESPPTPFTLAPGERRTIAVRMNPADTSFTFARWEFQTDACGNSVFYASAGRGKPAHPPIHLIAPNGGEVFRAGTETLVRWEGVPPADTVRLDYSIDGGQHWRQVAQKAAGLAYRWKVPPTPSTTCLMRVSQADDTASGERIVKTDTKTYAVSPDGLRVAGSTGEDEEGITIWSIEDGRELWKFGGSFSTFDNTGRMVKQIEFSPDGKQMLVETHGQTSHLVDIASNRIVRSYKGGFLNQRGNNFADNVSPFSPDGSRIVISAFADYAMEVWDVKSGKQIARMTNPHGSISNATFTSDGKELITVETDGTAQLWNASTGALVRTIKSRANIRSAVISPDGSIIATGADRPDDTLYLWNRASGELILRIPVGGAAAEHVPQFSPDGNHVMIWRSDVPMLADVHTGEVVQRFVDDNPAARRRRTSMYATFSQDGSMVGTYGFTGIEVWDTRTGQKLTEFDHKGNTIGMRARFTPDGTAMVWDFGENLEIGRVEPNIAQQDVSDNQWTITIDGRAASIGVDFGRRPVGAAVDSVVRSYIRNEGSGALVVDDVTINGAQARDFELVSGIPPFEVAPGTSHPVEFRFTPSSAGERSASVAISTSGGIVSQTLRGEGVRPQLRVEAKEIDFDSVLVGTERDTTVTVVLSNVGAAPLEVSEPRFIGPDTTQFTVVSGGGRFTLAPRESRAMTLRFNPSVAGRTSTRLAFAHNGIGRMATAELFGHGVMPGEEEEYVDPTTFRTIAAPNAILPKKGRIVTGMYDVVGLMAGYAITDNVMVLGGGGVRLPDEWGGVHGSMYGA
jgi:WD40 repeat protein